MKNLIAILLITAPLSVLGNKTQTAADRKMPDPKPELAAKKATNRNVGRATAKPFLASERPQNAFDVPLLRDAGTLPSLTAPRAGG